jgi:hypothetical protein
MIWTRLKKTAESLVADSLQGRIQYHLARYGPGVSYVMRRGWIAFDGHQIGNFSTIKRIRERFARTGNWYSEDEPVKARLDEEGFFTRDDFVNSLEEYVGLQLEDAVRSTNPIIRAVAMFDRRLGKRRLTSMSIADDEHQLVKISYQIRMQAEGFSSQPKTA